MKCVYIFRSLSAPGQRYFGITSDLRQRLAQHNQRQSSHTSKFSRMVETYIAFSDETQGCGIRKVLEIGVGKGVLEEEIVKRPPPRQRTVDH